ncbi:hypothetical protein [Streptomyces cylindrosporus]|uniref:Lipoprotein n=1 Tax=Streptomyces cylindrosporus TaxID=2927583 RepID=A0ABS9YFG3_9ACTN|nr:hypothetical protein [Streptomyces cylindrosporus]MCI3275366.1 hypothetical protein [Streptomyces cylindrosporus]
MSFQATPGRTDRIPSTVRLARGAALIGGLALLPLATACSGGEEDESRKASVTAAPRAGVVAPAKVEVIAALIGCAKPRIRVDAEELRQGVCHTKEADRVITTFPAEKYKLAWLDAASGYGGRHLVGTRWVVSAKPELLKDFRDKLGGDIQQLRGFGPTAAPSAS